MKNLNISRGENIKSVVYMAEVVASMLEVCGKRAATYDTENPAQPQISKPKPVSKYTGNVGVRMVDAEGNFKEIIESLIENVFTFMCLI